MNFSRRSVKRKEGFHEEFSTASLQRSVISTCTEESNLTVIRSNARATAPSGPVIEEEKNRQAKTAMSFCRITGKARGLPKPNYFPLLPPISPADAKRFCRITTKSQGLPSHHFIPALLGARGPRAHCRVTAKSEGQAPHHFPNVDTTLKTHDFIPGYKYVFPRFDEDKKQQQHILNIMSMKTLPGESGAKFVYAVEEKLTGLVIPAQLEAAVRDGDIRDLMLDKDNDTMLVKLNQGPSITIDVSDLLIEEGMILWDGLGPSQSVLKQREKEEREMEKRKKKRQEGLHKRRQIFEDKEKAADEEEMEIARIKDARKSKVVKVKMRGGAADFDVVVDHGPAQPEDYLSDANNEPVFGHIVQTVTAVEFFPGDTILKLPEGKVVPGQLLRNSEGIKFVPGIMSDGRFIPGQIVMTDSGELFVPGQVVDTRDGSKFVPGQVAETTSGPKFVPGQTIETEDGPQFVPGQIIETKAGPTFIPGQIIVTDDQPRFVPGRVVETAEGPRFVPGRVIESGNQVTFIPGQVVETSEGLKFIAPDLEYMPEGGHEFSVQGFEVSPEELKLLRPVANYSPASCGVVTIDSKMLRQLSEAGVSVGRQVPTKLPEVDVRSVPKVVEKLKLNGAQALKMSHIITILSQVALKISQRNDLCASEIDLDKETGNKILCAVKKKKDLGKHLQAIVASAVVEARNNFDEEGLMTAVNSALKDALFVESESSITKDSLLSVIDSIVETQLPQEEEITKKLLLQDIKSEVEYEIETRLKNSITTETVLNILDSVLKNELGQENGKRTKTLMLDVAKCEMEKKQIALYKEYLNKENFLTMVSAAIDPEILQKTSKLLSKDSLLKAICSEIENGQIMEVDWAFTEENILSIIKSAVEKEVSAKGVTLINGSLSLAIMSGIKKELSLKQECILTEEMIMTCLTSAAGKALSEESEEKLSKNGLMSAFKSAIALEKSRAKQQLLSEESLLSSAYAALEKTVAGKWNNLLDGEQFLMNATDKIQFEVSERHKSMETKKLLLENLGKSIQGVITDTCENYLNEEMAIAAIKEVLKSEVLQKSRLMLPEEKISFAISEAFKEENLSNKGNTIKKGKFLNILNRVIEEEASLADACNNKSVLATLDAAIEEKRKMKYEATFREEDLMFAIDSAVDAVLSEVNEMKVNRIELLSAVSNELEKAKEFGHSSVTGGRMIAAARSVIQRELSTLNEKTEVGKLLLKVFDSAVDEAQRTKCISLLTEEELLLTLDSAIESELLKIPECTLIKHALMESVQTAIWEKKQEKRKIILTEEILLDCIHLAITKETAKLSADSSMAESLMSQVNLAVQEALTKENQTSVFTEENVLEVFCSAVDSDLMENNISLTKEELVDKVNEALRNEKSANGDDVLTEEKVKNIIELCIIKYVLPEREAQLLLKAFDSAIELKKFLRVSNREKELMEIAGSAVESVLSDYGETAISRETLLCAINSAINDEVAKYGDLLMEETILATAYAAIEREASVKGESDAVKDLLLLGIDSTVESKRATKRVVDEEIILEAIGLIADEFAENAESKNAILSAVTSAMEKSAQGGSAPTGEMLRDVATRTVETHLSSSCNFTLKKESLVTAICSAIAKEQSAKRGSLLTKELLTTTVASAVEDQLSRNPKLLSVKERLLKATSSAIENQYAPAADRCLTENVLLASISSSIENVFGELSETTSLEGVVESMQKYLVENLEEVIVGTVNCMVANESPMDKLKYAVNNSSNTIQVIEKLSSVLNDNMGEAFQKLSTGDPTLLKNVIGLLEVEKISSKDGATAALQKAIVGAVRQRSVEALRGMMENYKDSSDEKDFKELLLQSVGLAKALGMNDVASVLLDVVSDSKSHEVLASDETVVDILQRLTIMRQFAETKPELATALRQLISDPELAKCDPGIRELVRHSTALMTVPEEFFQSSADIPASLLMSENMLMMEQFLAATRRPRTLLILKSGLQAVVPKEASRAVLTGQVPYAVLDEKGIKYFEPLHVFSTMKLPYYAAHCFSMYRCPEMEYENHSLTPVYWTPRGSFSSTEEFIGRERDRRGTMTNGYGDRHKEFGPRRFDRHFPMCRRITELCSRPGSNPLDFHSNLYEGNHRSFPSTYKDACSLSSGRVREKSVGHFPQHVYH